MVKEEVVKVINELRILTANYKKFREYVDTFACEPRCKKGVLDFVDTLLSYDNGDGKNYPAVFGKVRKELGLKLTVGKSDRNVQLFRDTLRDLYLDASAVNKLVETRIELVTKICEYVKHIQSELDKSELTDARERQVYLRRALARLKAAFSTYLVSPITKDNWAEVRPADCIPYLTDSLDEIINKYFTYDSKVTPWTVDWDHNELNNDFTVDSIETFLDYLDTFIKY